MAGIIDIHTHAFPDHIAAAAIPALEKEGNIKSYLDGTVSGLLASMDRSGIEQSVLCSIATRPDQFASILDWSKTIRSERIIPFPSLHPNDPRLLAHLQTIHDEGFKGVKMHPYYQEYFLDDGRLVEWADVRRLLTGEPIYMEISFALDFLDQIRLRDILLSHPPEYLLFGTDSPWTDQATTLKMLGKLGLPEALFARMTSSNAQRLLAS